jgi:predicted amidophosphoribosyltransferase
MVSRWGGRKSFRSIVSFRLPHLRHPAALDFPASGLRGVPCFPACDRRLRVLSLWVTNIVSLPGVRNRRKEPRCGLCCRILPQFAEVVAHGSYEGGLRELIYLLKYGGIERSSIVLGRPAADAIDIPLRGCCQAARN